MKKLLFTILISLVVIYFSLGIIAKSVIESQVKRQTGVALSVGFVSIKPFSGTAVIDNLTIENPENFEHYDDAFSLQNISGEIELASLFNSPLRVKSLHITKPELYVEMLAGQNNLIALKEQVQANMSPAAKEAPTQTEGEFKLLIDELIISDSAVHMAAGVIPAGSERTYTVGTIELYSIGKETNGADIANVTGLVIAEIQKRLGDLPRRIILSTLGDVSSQLLSVPLNTLKGAPGMLMDAPETIIDSVKDAPESALDGLKSGADTLKDALPFGN